MHIKNIHIAGFDNESLSVREYGDSQSPNVAVVFVHGLGGDKEAWEFTIHELEALDEKKQLTFYTYDLRGHGRSTRTIYEDLPIYKTNSADLKTIIDNITQRGKYSHVVLVGHSFGSFVVQEYLYTFPHPQVKKAVLISAPEKSRGWKLPSWVTKLFLSLPTMSAVHRTRKEYRKYIGTGDLNLSRIIADVRSVGLAQYLALESMMSGSAVTADKKRIQIPLYVLTGEKDSYFPLTQMDEFQKSIHAKKFIVFHDTNHIVPINNSKALAKAIFSILENV